MTPEESKKFGELLARIDERTVLIQTQFASISNEVRTYNQTINERMLDLSNKMEEEKKEVRELADRLKKEVDEKLKDYVKASEFNPVKTIVYGIVGIVLITVLGALLGTVILKV